MFGVSRLTALILAFCLGILVGAGALAGGVSVALQFFTLRDLEDNNIVPIPDEMFIGPNPEVDLFDLTAFQLVDEYKKLQSFGDSLTLNVVQERYDLLFHEGLDQLLSDEARNMPLKQLFSQKGINTILDSVYIGNIEKYECRVDAENEFGYEEGKPSDPNSYWVTSEGNRLSGLEEIIADYSLKDFMDGKINTDTLLGDVVLCDVLGYTFDETRNAWFDKEGNKVTGIMATFADCHIDEVSTKMNSTEIGLLIGYEKEEGKWYEYKTVEGQVEPVKTEISGFMSKIANCTLSGEGETQKIGEVFDTLVISDVVTNRTGVLSIIPADTTLNGIDAAVTSSIKETPLQFFMNEGLISFGESQKTLLDQICQNDPTNKMKVITEEEYLKYYYKEGSFELTPNSDGTYTVAEWRKVPLSGSFSYIMSILPIIGS